MSDRIFGIVIILIAIFYGWGTSLIHESFIQDPVGPKAFPYGLSVLGIIFGAYMVWRPDENPSWPAREGMLEIAAAALAMCIYAFMLPIGGFILCTIVAAAYFAWRFGSAPVGALITGLSISFGLYAVFHLALGLTLAKGPLGF